MASLAEQMFANAQGAIAESKPVDAALQGYQFAQQVQAQKQDLENKREQLALAKTDSLFKTIEFGATKVPKGARKDFFNNVIMPRAQQLGFPMDKDAVKMILGDETLTTNFGAAAAKYATEKDPAKRAELAQEAMKLTSDPEAFLKFIGEFEGKAFDIENKQKEFGFKVGKDTRDYARDVSKDYTAFTASLSNEMQQAFKPVQERNQQMQVAREAMAEAKAAIKRGESPENLRKLQETIQRTIAMSMNKGTLTDQDVNSIAGASGIINKADEWIAKNLTGELNMDQLKKLEPVLAVIQRVTEREAMNAAKTLEPRFATPQFADKAEQTRRIIGLDQELAKYIRGNKAQSIDPAKIEALKSRISELKAAGKTDAELLAQPSIKNLSPEVLKQLGLNK